jgi:predicted secreted protein
MQWTSIIAIYALFWVLSAFLVMPFGMRTAEEDGLDLVPGQAESAPATFRPWRIVRRTTMLAAVLFGLFYLNYVYGWIGADMLDMFGNPPDLQS